MFIICDQTYVRVDQIVSYRRRDVIRDGGSREEAVYVVDVTGEGHTFIGSMNQFRGEIEAWGTV